MRIVLDTNCLIQSISPRSRYYAVWQSLIDGENILCVSNEIITEYLEILQRLTDHDTAETIIKTIINSPSYSANEEIQNSFGNSFSE